MRPGATGQRENRKGIFAIYEILSDLWIRIIFPTLYHVSDLLPKWLANTFFTREVEPPSRLYRALHQVGLPADHSTYRLGNHHGGQRKNLLDVSWPLHKRPLIIGDNVRGLTNVTESFQRKDGSGEYQSGDLVRCEEAVLELRC